MKVVRVGLHGLLTIIKYFNLAKNSSIAEAERINIPFYNALPYGINYDQYNFLIKN